MPEKAIYSLTEAGEKQLENLMFEISAKPIQIFLDFKCSHCQLGCPFARKSNEMPNRY